MFTKKKSIFHIPDENPIATFRRNSFVSFCIIIEYDDYSDMDSKVIIYMNERK